MRKGKLIGVLSREIEIVRYEPKTDHYYRQYYSDKYLQRIRKLPKSFKKGSSVDCVSAVKHFGHNSMYNLDIRDTGLQVGGTNKFNPPFEDMTIFILHNIGVCDNPFEKSNDWSAEPSYVWKVIEILDVKGEVTYKYARNKKQR